MERTDWDRYYHKPFAATRVTRRITGNRLAEHLARHRPYTGGGLVVAELGGANSCFFSRVQALLHPREYHVVDLNRLGLDRMRERLGPRADVLYHRADVLDLHLDPLADVVFSVGLVEHFSPEDTRRAVDAHFRILRPGGTCVIAFPTPTLLYRATRGVAELFGAWEFPDERPLRRGEVALAMEPHAEVVDGSIVWPIFLTQMFLVARAPARSSAPSDPRAGVASPRR